MRAVGSLVGSSDGPLVGETVCVDSYSSLSIVSLFTFTEVVSSIPFTRRGNGVLPETPLTTAVGYCEFCRISLPSVSFIVKVPPFF